MKIQPISRRTVALCTIAILCSVAVAARLHAQESLGTEPVQHAPVAASEIAVTSRGLHQRVWEWDVKQVAPSGDEIVERRSFVELASGMHRLMPDGLFVETDPAIDVSPDGQSGLVRNLQYNVIFAGNLATPNALEVLLPDGQRLTGHLLCLAYFDGPDSLLIAEPKDVVGEIIGSERNHLVFRPRCALGRARGRPL